MLVKDEIEQTQYIMRTMARDTIVWLSGRYSREYYDVTGELELWSVSPFFSFTEELREKMDELRMSGDVPCPIENCVNAMLASYRVADAISIGNYEEVSHILNNFMSYLLEARLEQC